MRKLTFEAAKAQFVNRYTMENVPRHAQTPAANGKFYAPQYASDKEWYDRTFFKGENELATARHCYSTNPSWPVGQWLDAPFNK